VDGRAVTLEVKQLMEPLAQQKGLRVECRLPDKAEMISDATKIRQILVNLVGNAVKFTDTGTVTLAVREEGDCTVFDVADTGPGIPAESLGKIFEPFWQVDSTTTRKAGGTGLGLSVTQKLARLLGGDVEVESELGKGTTFRVRLPKRTDGEYIA
ncbi:MAG TPA: ATP-binding protein, partial [Longimicrobiales bacterium]|nr:ATP-binding protein [Longimicrobiales bacterium]